MKPKLVIFTLFIFLICLSIGSPLWAKDKNKAKQLYDQGINALEQGEYEAGINILEKALIYAPDSKDTISMLSLGYNNHGVILSRQPGQIEKAIFNLERATQLSPANTGYRHNLSDLYAQRAKKFYEQEKEYRQAVELSDKALEYNPNNFLALEILGDCYYFTQDLNAALDYWQKAQKLKPESKRLDDRIKRVKRELRAASDFTRSAADYFDIRLTRKNLPFDAYLIRDYLRSAYREVGQDFNYFPKHPIIVLIYTEEEFRQYYPDVYGAVAAYDGKIHLPASAKNFTPNQFKSLIWHEYTHAVIAELTNNKCPLWLNEGLAVWEGSRYDPMGFTELNKARETGNIISPRELHEKFASAKQKEKMYLAYEEAYTIVSFLVQRYGFWHIQKALAKIKNQDNNIEEILKSVFSLNWGTLEKKWQEYLKTLKLT